MLQANALTGALLLAALALTDLRLASAALVGSAAASMTAVLTGAERRDIEQGLHGFNGALAALIAVLFAPHQLAAIVLVPLASIGAALVQRAMRVPLARWRQCPYSAPCLAVTALWFPFVALQQASGATAGPALTFSSAADALLSGIAQTTFAQGAWAGALIVVGLAVASAARPHSHSAARWCRPCCWSRSARAAHHSPTACSASTAHSPHSR